MNFALIASIVFGRKGYVLSSGLLSTLLLGWYAVQTGIIGNLISSTYHLNYVLMTVVAGVLYIPSPSSGLEDSTISAWCPCRSSSCSEFGSPATPWPATVGRQ